MEEVRFKLDIRKKLFTARMVRSATSCPVKLWMPHHWKCSKSDRMGLWAAWLSERCACPQQWGWIRCSL